MKSLIKNLLEWIIAGVCAIFIVSLCCFLYYRPVGWIERGANATSAIWEPDSVIVNGMEGYGILHVDENGYVNMPGKELSEHMVLCIGASFTQGKEVMEGQKYTDLLDTMLAEEEERKVYNLSRDAYFYPEMVAGLAAAVEEFPQTEVVVLEIGNTDFSLTTLDKALQQRKFDMNQTGKELYKNMPMMGKIKMKIKDYLPILSVVKYQMSQMQGEETNKVQDSIEYDSVEYTALLDKSLQLVRDSFEGKIIVLYHPAITLDKQGGMECVYSKSFNNFSDLCEKHDILLVDMGKDFMNAYVSQHIVPYGFFNTTMGEGHLNRDGHRLIAERLFQVINEGE